MSDTLLVITCCYDPWHGSPKSRAYLSAADQAEWVLKALLHYQTRYRLRTALVVSAFPGVALTEGGRCRDTWYQIFDHVKLLSVAINPSHQLGAALTLKMGMEYAGHARYKYLINTAEDVIPRPGSLEAKLEAIRSGEYDFVGGIGDLNLAAMPLDQHQWIKQKGPRLIGAGCQLFACNVGAFAWSWDAGIVKDCIEIHMGNFIADKRYLSLPEEYEHTHNYGEWLKYEERYRA